MQSYDDIWMGSVQKSINRIIKDNELPADSIILEANKSKTEDMITSYSIKVCGYDYPTSKDSKSTLFNIKHIIKSDVKLLEIVCPNSFCAGVDCPTNAVYKTLASDKQNTYVRINKDSDELQGFMEIIIKAALDNFSATAASFACCGKYVECSDAGKCLHENKLFSKGCSYRKNLESGRFFYGKNAKKNY